MTKKELEQQIRDFTITTIRLANSMTKMRDAKKDIEKKAQDNEGELTPDEAARHTILASLYDKAYGEIVKALNKFP